MAAMDVDYLQKLGLRVSSGKDAGPVLLQKRFLFEDAVSAGANAGGSRAAAAAAEPKFDPKFVCTPIPGFSKELIKREGHPPWMQPNAGVSVGLRATNTLTGDREEFRPMEGKKVRWYTCGPTVYDVSHMGHARAYLTFDILRRIMADYFKYDLKYQINITDIDDKIILRSRQNKLFDDFTKESEGMACAALEQAVDDALKVAEQKLLAKRPEDLPAGASEKEKIDYEKLMGEHALKVGQFKDLQANVTAAKGNKAKLLEAAREPLMAKLDKERGHTVTDHSIFLAHCRHFEDEYFADMDALGVLRPDVVSRISDYMDGRVQKFIEKLEDDGNAYCSQGSVYFDIDGFNSKGFTYRKLVPAVCCTAAEMEEGEGALAANDGEKRNPNDFAVWKKSKPGEPAWESRWGPGRPGWHIECSVMATDINGEFLDIHAGGEDLKFPHHDNEMAQSEAFLGRKQWVNYFWHAGHLHIQGLKMSKSLKNFITIRQAMEVHTARQLRLMFLMQQWDRGMNYSDDAINMAKAEERKLKHFVGCLKMFVRRGYHSKAPAGEREKSLLAALAECKDGVDAALKDNFNTSKAVELISKLVGDCYKSFDALPEACLEPVEKVRDFVVEFVGILGVVDLAPTREKEADWAAALDAFAGLREEVRQLQKEKAGTDKLLAAVDKAKPAAAAAKKAGLADCAGSFESFLKDLAGLTAPADILRRCDEVRDKDFVGLGVRLEDRGASGFVWMFEDKTALLREAQEAEEKKAEQQRQKLARSLEQKQVFLRTAEKSSVRPQDLYKNGPSKALYAEFDETGMPTKLASGDDVPKQKAKDFKKELGKQEKDYEKLLKTAGDAGIDAYLSKLRKEVQDLEKQIGGE